MGYWSLLKQNPRTLGFGFLNTFFSGIGQTHFVSLFSPVIMAQLSLTATEYGSLYSLVTLISGFCIVFVGPKIDQWDARLFSVAIGFGLCLSLATLYPLASIYTVGVGLFGLRFFGQGLCSSLSSITVARFFHENRGKALSLSQLGYPTFEGFITPLAALIMSYVTFQNFLVLLSLPLLFIFIPLGYSLTKNQTHFNKAQKITTTSEKMTGQKQGWTRKQVFTHPKVYLLLPHTLMPPFALTGLFFHQAMIAGFKTWSLELMASGLFFFASGRVLNTFITGPLVDKHSATKLFPYYQIPLALGFYIMGAFSGDWVPAACFALCGISVGSGGPIKSAIWAELYGVQHLGAIKSSFATLMILSTAASPALFGWVLDRTQSASTLLYILAGSSLLFAALSFLALTKTKVPAE